jgi:hypothetical protein
MHCLQWLCRRNVVSVSIELCWSLHGPILIFVCEAQLAMLGLLYICKCFVLLYLAVRVEGLGVRKEFPC